MGAELCQLSGFARAWHVFRGAPCWDIMSLSSYLLRMLCLQHRNVARHTAMYARSTAEYLQVGRLRQAYFIFAVGNLRPIFDVLYADCYKTHTACSKALVASQTYTQVRRYQCVQAGCAVLYVVDHLQQHGVMLCPACGCL